VQCTPLVARDGRLLGTLGNYFRVTGRPDERKLRLLDLLARQASDLIEHQQADDALRDADRRKDEFLAMLAHELRNPLAPIRNAAHVLRGTSDANVVREMSDVLERQVTHMVRLVDDLLDVSRISRGKIELRREPTDLTDVINQAVETVRSMVASRDHELTLVEPTHPVYANADPARLTQVVGNLLNNACKFTERNGRIRLSVEQQADEAQRVQVVLGQHAAPFSVRAAASGVVAPQPRGRPPPVRSRTRPQ